MSVNNKLMYFKLELYFFTLAPSALALFESFQYMRSSVATHFPEKKSIKKSIKKVSQEKKV